MPEHPPSLPAVSRADGGRIRVNLIGAGKVGRAITSLLLAADGVEIGAVSSRSESSALAAIAGFGQGRIAEGPGAMPGADLWLIATPDDQIADTARALATASGLHSQPAAIVHFSGFLSSSVFRPLQDLGWQAASCHPVRSFATPHLTPAEFAGTLCGIEGDEGACKLIRNLITASGGQPFPLTPEGKVLYHAAAVFSNNFTTLLQALALEAWEAAGVAPDTARALGEGLLQSTAENLSRLGPRAALTGPAARGDHGVIAEQGAVVSAWSPQAGALYASLSDLALRLKREGKVTG